ncbi:MAG: thioredoxin domain-containing protein, partial [Chloroflexota bacterium]
AAFMNEHFVNVKVDREERPDVDSIYMGAVVALTGQGGWPMTVILTAEGEPFFGGTYFPPTPRYGMPSFRQVLESVARAWKTRRAEIEDSAEQITGQLNRMAMAGTGAATVADDVLVRAKSNIERQFDATRGGFGQAPKFPQAMTIEFLLRYHLKDKDSSALLMAERTLEAMARGGMYDQLGGGFARYSTDNEWLVPHFEKMLYDNALLSAAYLHAWRITGRPLYRRIVEETLDWVMVEMRHELGGFYSSLDADSEGIEGKFYVWDAKEIERALGDDAPLFKRYFGVTSQGNWEGNNILSVASDIGSIAAEFGLTEERVKVRIGRGRSELYAIRARRPWPGLDTKVLTAWNGLMMASFAEAGRDLGRADYLAVAEANAVFLHDKLRKEDGRLLRSWKEGHGANFNAYLEDYAYLAQGLLALYQSNFDARWYVWALGLIDMILTHFDDDRKGGFYDTSADHESLILRPKDIQDNATPSGGAAAANAMLQISLLNGDRRFWDTAATAVRAIGELPATHPTGFAHWLCATDLLLSDALEIAIVGEPDAPEAQRLLEVVFGRYRPNMVVAAGVDEERVPLLRDRPQIEGQATAYVCRQFVCKAPVTEPSELEALLP